MKKLEYTSSPEHGVSFEGQFLPAKELRGTQEEALRICDNLGLWSFVETWATIRAAIATEKAASK